MVDTLIIMSIENSENNSESEFEKQLQLQRLAFERQFGTLEEMGFDDATKKAESEEELDSASNDEFEDESASQDDSSAAEETGSENEASLGSNTRRHEKVSSTPETQPQRGPKVISFGDALQNNVDNASRIKLTDTIIKKMQNKNKPQTLKKKTRAEEASDNEEEEVERKNMQNDIELQNFIRDSHLLNSFGGSDFNSSSDVVGKARMKVMESQMKNLVSQNNHISQKNKNRLVDGLEKVPVNIRKGMVSKHMKRISKYEEDAKDNGIVLAKQAKGTYRKLEFTYKKDIERRIGKGTKSKISKTPVMRDKGLRISAVGRSTRNGLIISKNEISRINGDNSNRGKGKGKKGSHGKKR